MHFNELPFYCITVKSRFVAPLNYLDSGLDSGKEERGFLKKLKFLIVQNKQQVLSTHTVFKICKHKYVIS